MQENTVEVQLRQHFADRKYFIVTMVRSQAKKGMKTNIEIDPGDANDANDLRRRVAIAAGACAERCCEKYGDKFDPDEIANISIGLLNETMKKYDDQKKCKQSTYILD